MYKKRTLLAEAIFIEDRPKWLISSIDSKNSKGVSLSIEDSIDISTDEKKAILKPPSLASYVNRPYVFDSKETLENLINVNQTTTLDSLYVTAKKIWQKYVAQGDKHLSLCAADCIFTYFQDLVGMTHYLFFVGDNDAGKSSNLHLFNFYISHIGLIVWAYGAAKIAR